MKKERRRDLVFALLTVTLSLCVAGAARAQTRDYWLKCERKGTPYAYEHVSVRRLDDGHLEYKCESRAKLDVIGVCPQDIARTGTYVVDVYLRPISFDMQLSSRAKDVHVTGTYRDGQMYLTIADKGSEVRKRPVPFEDTYFKESIADLILAREGQKRFNVKLFDSSDLLTAEVQVEIPESKPGEVRAVVTGPFTTEYWIDREGRITQMALAELGIRGRMCDPENARDIRCLKTDDGLTGTVRSKNRFPNVYKVTRAEIAMKWERIPFEEFSFEDNRQKITKQRVSGDEYEVVLKVTKAALPTKGTALPVENERFAPFLDDTEFIKPTDPSIKRQLAEIKGAEEGTVAITLGILNWISDNIRPDAIVETLTGPEVLEKRRGKCSEYATLFASLARAAGIPTKVALGEAYVGDRWIGHMWNEVWLGEWVTVDPSHGAFVTGPALVKLVDSASVIGTQSVRYKLVDNLSIEILDFAMEEVAVATEMQTGVSEQTYSNQAYSCRISAPDSSWEIDDSAEGVHPTVLIKPRDEKDKTTSFALVLFAVPPGFTAEKILKGRLNAISVTVKNFEQLEDGEAEIAGRKVPKVVFQQDVGDGLTLVNENCILVDGANAYLFASIAPKEKFAELRPSFQEILDSFEIVK
jgi:hypothetical protein